MNEIKALAFKFRSRINPNKGDGDLSTSKTIYPPFMEVHDALHEICDLDPIGDNEGKLAFIQMCILDYNKAFTRIKEVKPWFIDTEELHKYYNIVKSHPEYRNIRRRLKRNYPKRYINE